MRGYEIHHGQTQAGPQVQAHLAAELGWQQANIYGVYLHGLLENTAYRQWFLDQLGWRGVAEDWAVRLDAEIERAATLITNSKWQFIETHQ